jgi:hypothetical protein
VFDAVLQRKRYPSRITERTLGHVVQRRTGGIAPALEAGEAI